MLVFDDQGHALTVVFIHINQTLTSGQFAITCEDLLLVADGFESGDTSAWS